MTHGLVTSKTLVLLVTAFSWNCANAMESHYVVNQKPDKNTFELKYMFSDADYHTELFRENSKAVATSNILAVELRRTLENNQSVWINGKIIDQKVSINNQSAVSSVGLGDIEMGYKKGEVYDFLTSVFGATASLSPGLAQDPRLAQLQRINSFSGTQSLAPFVGVEAYSGSMAVGSTFEVRLFSDIRYDDGADAKTYTNPNRFIPKIKGFVEVPIAKTWDWGMEVSVARYNFAVDQLLFGGVGNEYEAMMYGQWKVESKTAILAMISTKDQKYPLPKTNVDLSLGFRKEM